jgi:pimeloyl-ACP methyl ester carboxylesterase
MNSLKYAPTETRGYVPVNGLKMYYEIEGSGDPLVYLPPVFGHAGVKSFPSLAHSHLVTTVDFQGHGRTADIPERPLTLEQIAKDVVGLLKYLGISRADFFGESYGGVIATMLAVRHPELIGRVATYGATFGPAQVAHNPEMLRFDHPPTPDSSCFQFQKEAYRKVAPDPDYWSTFWGKVMGIRWEGFSNEDLASIKAPVLIAVGDHDFVRLEHAVETFRRIPNAQLTVIPDAGHFALFSEPARVVPAVEHFLAKPAKNIPIATSEMGYRPGETR